MSYALASHWDTLAFVFGAALCLAGSGFLICHGWRTRSRFQIALHSFGIVIWLVGVMFTVDRLYMIGRYEGRVEGLLAGQLERLYLMSRCRQQEIRAQPIACPRPVLDRR